VTAPTVSVVEEVRAVRALVDEAATVEDCLALADDARAVLAVVESQHRPRPGEARPPAVRYLAAAVVHLGRAGGAVPVELACRLASADLALVVGAVGGAR
jgi:hypothetical protein